jgi:hypothetical protein
MRTDFENLIMRGTRECETKNSVSVSSFRTTTLVSARGGSIGHPGNTKTGFTQMLRRVHRFNSDETVAAGARDCFDFRFLTFRKTCDKEAVI